LKKIYLYILIIPFLLVIESFTGFSLFSKTVKDTVEDEHGIYLFRYDKVVKTNVDVIFSGDSIYIPVQTILSRLSIDNLYNPKIQKISGYFISTDSTYNIDFNTNTASYNKNKVSFTKEDYKQTELEIYMKPFILEKLFNLKINI
jgi:uncharacterized protein (UPF0297 family)